MVTFVAMVNPPLVRPMVRTLAAKSMKSPDVALASASRSDPAPASAPFTTVSRVGVSRSSRRSNLRRTEDRGSGRRRPETGDVGPRSQPSAFQVDLAILAAMLNGTKTSRSWACLRATCLSRELRR